MRFWKSCKFFSALCVCLLLSLAACQPRAEENPQNMQKTSAAVRPLVIHTAKNAVMFEVERATTPEEHARGLMYRKDMAPNHGMLFVFPEQRPLSFWMENTLIPLDMIFIRSDGTIAHIHPMAKPLDRTPISSSEPVIAVLEILGGESAKQGIRVGDTLDPALLKTE